MKPSSAKISPTSASDSRLQKVLAAAGLGSRRHCEELILAGRVEVDRQVVTELGTRVDPSSQDIRVDGVSMRREKKVYFAVHKPTGVVSTSQDPWRRPRVVDLVETPQRIFTIGRLDKESSGLILVTNDGELANQLTHPRYGVSKTYHVTVAGSPSVGVLERLRRGVMLAEGPVRPESVVVKKRVKQSTLLEIVLTEGRNREIRRMLARVEHKVLTLHRVAIGPVRLGLLPRGAYRDLTPEEVRALHPQGRSQRKPSTDQPEKSSELGLRGNRQASSPPAKSHRERPYGIKSKGPGVRPTKSHTGIEGSEEPRARKTGPRKSAAGGEATGSRAGGPHAGKPGGARKLSATKLSATKFSASKTTSRPNSGKPSSGKPAGKKSLSGPPAKPGRKQVVGGTSAADPSLRSARTGTPIGPKRKVSGAKSRSIYGEGRTGIVIGASANDFDGLMEPGMPGAGSGAGTGTSGAKAGPQTQPIGVKRPKGKRRPNSAQPATRTAGTKPIGKKPVGKPAGKKPAGKKPAFGKKGAQRAPRGKSKK